jgi:hypothetical protein
VFKKLLIAVTLTIAIGFGYYDKKVTTYSIQILGFDLIGFQRKEVIPSANQSAIIFSEYQNADHPIWSDSR